MTELIPVVKVENGRAVADSRDVAVYFMKEHKHVLRDIRELHCSVEFRQSNFGPCIINDLRGIESTSHVMMTRSGFMFLVGGYTGAAAGRFKESYINQFDAMEAELRRRPAPAFNVKDPGHVVAALAQSLQYVRELEEHNATLQENVVAAAKTIEHAKPHVEFCKLHADCTDTVNLRELAKALDWPPEKLKRWLLANNYIFYENKTLTYYSKWKQLDIMTKRQVPISPDADGNPRFVNQLRFTTKGIQYFAAKLTPQLV